jgi:hypothetical protein
MHMKTFVLVVALAVLAAPLAHADPSKRDTLAGFNGFVFGATFVSVKGSLGSAAKPDTDPGDPTIKILLAETALYGETFSVNYTFAGKGRFSAAYAVAHLPTGDHGVCQTRWVGVLARVEEQWGKPDGNLNTLGAAIPSQTVTYIFDDGAAIEAGIMGCLLTLNYLSPAAAK